jgi:hypothetical protein
MSKGLLALAGFAGGMAKGALDHDQALKKTAAEELRDQALHLRAMAMAKYQHKGAVEIAGMREEGANERAGLQADTQLETTGMTIDASQNRLDQELKAKAGESAADRKLRVELTNKDIAARKALAEQGRRYQEEDMGSGYYRPDGKELTKAELSGMSQGERGEMVKNGELLSAAEWSKKASEAEMDIFERKEQIKALYAKDTSGAQIQKTVNDAIKGVMSDPAKIARMEEQIPGFEELTTAQKRTALRAYFSPIYMSGEDAQAGGPPPFSEENAPLTDPKVFQAMVDSLIPPAAESPQFSRTPSNLNPQPKKQPPQVDEEGRTIHPMPPRY